MTAPSDEVFLGLDLGTSGLKAVALDAQARVLARAQRRYATQRSERGAAEQDTNHWIDAVSACVQQLCEVVDAARVKAIGLSGMLPTLVTVDSTGSVIGNAITWQDDRAERHGQRLRDAVGADYLYERSGQWLDGRYLLPMYLRLADCDPTRAANTQLLLGAKDWLFSWLTGAALTDPSTATGVGAYQLEPGAWLDDVTAATAQLAGRPTPALPEIVPADTLLPLRPEAAAALGLAPGVPVCVGGADSVLGALGLGATEARAISYIAGTSTVILGTTTTLRPDPAHRYLITPLAGAPGWAYEMDLLSTGSAIRWLADLLGLEQESDVLELAAGADREAAPIFLPYLAPGEQGALWNPDLTGSILGLHLGQIEPRSLEVWSRESCWRVRAALRCWPSRTSSAPCWLPAVQRPTRPFAPTSPTPPGATLSSAMTPISTTPLTAPPDSPRRPSACRRTRWRRSPPPPSNHARTAPNPGSGSPNSRNFAGWPCSPTPRTEPS